MQSSRSQMFFKIGVLKNSQISQENTMLESLFNEVAGLKAWNFIKKRLQHLYFPVKFAKFLRTLFFKEHLLWLLLQMEGHFIVFPFFITMI